VGHMTPVAVAGGAAIAYVTACWPDIDTPRSKAARFLPPFTAALSWAIRKGGGGHRGVTHRPVGVIAFAVIMLTPLAFWPVIPWWVPAAAITGYVCHLLVDGVTTLLGIKSGRRKRPKRGPKWYRRAATYGAEFWAVRPLAYMSIAVFAVIITWRHQ
jgi:LexA-binding, inner membrane-associated putative hydrolase